MRCNSNRCILIAFRCREVSIGEVSALKRTGLIQYMFDQTDPECQVETLGNMKALL
jgi:hypothetical protein